MIKEVSVDQGQVGVPVTHSRQGIKKAAGYSGKVWAGDVDMGIVNRI